MGVGVGHCSLTLTSFPDLSTFHNKEDWRFQKVAGKEPLAIIAWSSGKHFTYHILRNNGTPSGVCFLLSWQQPSPSSPFPLDLLKKMGKGLGQEDWPRYLLTWSKSCLTFLWGEGEDLKHPARLVYMCLFYTPLTHLGIQGSRHSSWQSSTHREDIQATSVDWMEWSDMILRGL